MASTNNQAVLDWVDEQIALMQPEKVVWIDGSKAQQEQLREEACHTGELHKLNQEKLPGCYLHRSDPNDVARVESRTFICCDKQENAGPTNNWMHPDEMYPKLRKLFNGSMKDKALYVIPYSMGVVGSPFAKYGFELTDSIYVVLSMAIMTRVGQEVLDALGDSPDFIKGIHSNKDINPDERYIVQFPEDNTIMSINSGYGGNVLQGKKCFSLRIASHLGKQEGWLAEHMLILGVQNPKGEVRYIAAAFPSACGKTNLAMIIPPAGYQKDGWKAWCVGDDIAWIRTGEDGRFWAANPEYGFFGVAPGTNVESNPNALATTHKDTIFINVALNLQDDTVWWEKLDKKPPENALDWLGNPWNGDCATTKGAHPNSRFTSPITNCPCVSPEFENPQGVPLSAIVFGGRRAKTAPLVYQSRDWNHGVFVGSIMASETTAASTGKVGVVRRDPMAMLPFCGYHMADYWQHWLDTGKATENRPKIFNVNWFRTDENGEFIWPGFGENLRVLEWILRRAFDDVDAQVSPIGYLPNTKDINIEGIDLTEEQLSGLLNIDKDLWKEEVENIREFYADFNGKVPAELWAQLEQLEHNLNS